jgi:hypothetical protein
VLDHRQAGERVQDLRQAGAHAGPLPGSQHDGCDRSHGIRGSWTGANRAGS